MPEVVGWVAGDSALAGDGREAVRLSVYDSLSLRWNVTIGEQGSSLGQVHRDSMHERLHKTCIPVFVQEHQANFTMVYN